jgi:hypothetical protein
MIEQILAIAPILPGQKVNSAFDIPPRAATSPTDQESEARQNPKASMVQSDGGNDLIDFGHSASNEKAVQKNQQISSQQRKRSVSLMDDDRPFNTMNSNMGNMRIMEPTRTPAKSPTGKEEPLKRTDTQTSEVDAFFDAEG